MHWLGRLSHAKAVGEDDHTDATAAAPADGRLVDLAANLRAEVEAVTSAEFAWQEAHYNHDSRQGRELLFLMANHEWVRATSEIVDITRSDTIETTIKIDVDLGQVTHEAFRKRTGPIWLPVAVLPPYTPHMAADQGLGEPDLFATVTDAAGNPVPMLPAADLQHQISAAMAEIIAKMAVSRMSAVPYSPMAAASGDHSTQEPPIATRDQRVLLSAAIYRMLRQNSDKESQPVTSASIIEPPRLTQARRKLLVILDYYVKRLKSLVETKVIGAQADTEDPFPAELARRAVKVLQALSESLIVVVLAEYVVAPSVLSVRVPPRKLTVSSASLLKPRTWIIRPAGCLKIDVLMPTADADRQLQINLPEGVSVDGQGDTRAESAGRPGLDMTVHTPLPLQDLRAALDQVLAAQRYERDGIWSSNLVRPFIDLLRVSAAEAVDTLRHYKVTYLKDDARDLPADEPQGDPISALRQLAEDPNWRSKQFMAYLRTAQRSFTTNKPSLSRHVKLNVVNPQTITARVNMIESVSQRAIPKRATVSVDVTVEDRDYFATARSPAFMSLILMLGVLGFLLGWHAVNPNASGPAPEVLAIVLTLFATTQADRIERPDRSTLRGRLHTFGNWLIAASMLPALTLAIALGFEARGVAAYYWAAGCVGAQLCLVLIMQNGPLVPAGRYRFGKRRILSTDAPDYRHFEALRSDYWRDTTAEALMIGRKAYGYIVWQTADPEIPGEAISPKLRPLLAWNDAPPTESGSVLALLRTGTLRQAVTFVVFRGQPDEEWPNERNGHNGHDSNGKFERKAVDLDPGRLTPATSVTRMVDLFVGVSSDAILTIEEHPVSMVLQAATNRLTVLDVQLPVPAPVRCHDDKHWARIRLALRDSADIRRLSAFLGAVHTAMQRPENARHLVAVQTIPAARPYMFAGVDDTDESSADYGKPERPPVLTSDLDFVDSRAIDNEMPNLRTWRVLAICADARSNVESDILTYLAEIQPHFQLAALTYALLHGTAVMVLFVHEPPGSQAEAAEETAEVIEAAFRQKPGCGKLRVLLSRRLSRQDLEPVVEYAYPMLSVHFRWKDRPGATLNVLNSISDTLAEALPAIERRDWSVSYARIQVLTGQEALGRLTIRMHVPQQDIANWSSDNMEEKARKIESLAAAKAAKQAVDAARKLPDASTDALDTPEEPVIRIDRIKKVLRCQYHSVVTRRSVSEHFRGLLM
jgi:hypothetical protein